MWDLEGNKFTDMSLMGVGTNILGYSNKKIDRKVGQIVNQGNLSTLNCPEEVMLAEQLINSPMGQYGKVGQNWRRGKYNCCTHWKSCRRQG